MASERVERKLAAILAADVVGYSRLMGADEEETLARLNAHRRALIDPKIAEYRGRIVKTTGDGILIEFPSVVDALLCAVEMQQGMVERNVGVRQDRRIEFRVGINLGDVIVERDDLFGDGINVAARLQELAQPGGVCVSRTVRDHVRDKLPFRFEDLGEQTVRNIARPLRIFRVNWDVSGRKRDEQGGLIVSTMGSFAIKWLVPRLARFRAAHPEIDVRLQANDALVDFTQDDVDLAIRYGRGQYPGLKAERLMTEDFVPVCSPALLKGPHPLRAPEDLRHYPLLHEEGTRIDWRMWLMAAGVEGVDPTRGPIYSHSSMVMQAVINGEGVALGRTALIAEDLAAGRLVKPFELALPAEWAYYVVYPPRALARPKVRAFRDWLLAEVAPDNETSSAERPVAS